MRSLKHQAGVWALVAGLCAPALCHAGTTEAQFQVSLQLRPAELQCNWGELVLRDALVACAPAPAPTPTPQRPSTERTLEIWSSSGQPIGRPIAAAMWGGSIDLGGGRMPYADFTDLGEAAPATVAGGCRWGLVHADVQSTDGSALQAKGLIEAGPFLWRCEPLTGGEVSQASPSDHAQRAQAGLATTHLALARSLSQHGQRPSLVVAY